MGEGPAFARTGSKEVALVPMRPRHAFLIILELRSYKLKPTDITDADFEEVVLKSTLPVLVDFWAPWCGPCRAMAPVIEELAREYQDKIRFVKINTDEDRINATRLGISGIPTFILFKDGKETERILGYMPKSELKRRLDAALQ